MQMCAALMFRRVYLFYIASPVGCNLPKIAWYSQEMLWKKYDGNVKFIFLDSDMPKFDFSVNCYI